MVEKFYQKIKMNKKGFIRIIEAVLAIIIIFVAILTVLPEKKVSSPEIPYELESSAEAILEEIQNNEKFRACILGKDIGGEEAPACVSNFVEESLPFGNALEFAFMIIDKNEEIGALYNNKGESEVEGGILPDETNVYAKSIFISVDDVTAPELVDGSEYGEYKTLRLYFWFRIEE